MTGSCTAAPQTSLFANCNLNLNFNSVSSSGLSLGTYCPRATTRVDLFQPPPLRPLSLPLFLSSQFSYSPSSPTGNSGGLCFSGPLTRTIVTLTDNSLSLSEAQLTIACRRVSVTYLKSPFSLDQRLVNRSTPLVKGPISANHYALTKVHRDWRALGVTLA